MTFKEATDLLAVPLDEIARVLNRSYPTVMAYRNGVRAAPPEVMRELAAFMRTQAPKLEAAADAIDGASPE